MLNSAGKERAQEFLADINRMAKALAQPIVLMEVCGTHTVAIAQNGIREILPDNVRLLSGPGCPVCVTDDRDIDLMIELAERAEVIFATYGDLIRVPGSDSSLQEVRAQGAQVQVVYSALDALDLARNNPDKQVVMAGIGFETTAPTAAAAVEQAVKNNIANFSILSLHKTVPPALRILLGDPEVKVDALINPGHVCTILGSGPFAFVAQEFNCPCVIAGFDAIDILEAVKLILAQLQTPDRQVEIQYRRVVRPRGNPTAQDYIKRYFEPVPARWRGLGIIPDSGLAWRQEFAQWDTLRKFGLELSSLTAEEPGTKKDKACLCGAILKGQKLPYDCPSFGQDCTPLKPIGPCMVSSEGACAAYYRFKPMNK